MKVIQIKNLCKNFDEHILFKNFNLIIHDGDFLCISGDSGTGDSDIMMTDTINPLKSKFKASTKLLNKTI